MTSPTPCVDQRVLVHAPFGRDGAIVVHTLQKADISAVLCKDTQHLLSEVSAGAGAVIVTQECLTPESLVAMQAALQAQPPWSDLPFIVFLSRAVHDDARALKISSMLGNVTVLERPASRFAMVSTAQAALRARSRQYQVRDLLHRRDNEIQQRDQFLAMLGHELRNPLAAISQAIDVTKLRLPSDQPVPKALSVMRRQCDHLVHLVNDLLDVARVTTGKVTLAQTPTDLRAMVLNALGPLEGLFQERRLSLTTDFVNAPLMVNGDPTRLEQILTNLLNNALKYTPEGGSVMVSTRSEKEQVVFSIADTGVGLSPKMLASVFDLFVQSERSLDRAQGGLGIGLTVVRHLVHLHGGNIEAHSQGEGHGATFTVTLPALEQSIVAPKVSTKAPVPRTGLHVLVVEDNDDNREGIKELLEEIGYRVDVAADGEQGLRLAVRLHPDVAIVDIGLPALDGYQVARGVRSALGNKIHLVALTGYGQPEDVRRTTAAGFDAHVTKPASLESLLDALAVAGAQATG